LAPLIESVIDVHFDHEMTGEELESAREALGPWYPTVAATPFHRLIVHAETESLEVPEPQRHYRGQGEDPSEVVLLRPDGLAVSQLAPYRDWATLYRRFARDLGAVTQAIRQRAFARMAVRNINRIDVAPEGGIVRYEDYLEVYPRLPAALDPIGDFRLQLVQEVPEIQATAKITAGTYPQVAEGFASFVVDIDLFRTDAVPTDQEGLERLFLEFRRVKNDLYRTCLTRRALKEFDE
jgi:uncharacterized protein (TIGR04255 family)